MLRDRLNTQSPRYWFALDAALVTLSMAMMWPRLLWVACRACWGWLRDEWRTPLFWCAMLLAPFFFWLAPLLVLTRNRLEAGLPLFPSLLWLTFWFVLNAVLFAFNLLLVGVALVIGKPLLSGFVPMGTLALALLALVLLTLEIDRAVARAEAVEAV